MRTYEEQTALILDKVSQHNIARKKRIRAINSITLAMVILFSFTGLAFAAYTNLDLGRIFNSFFNNPSVDQRIDVGHSVIESGLEVTLLSAICDSNRAYMMVEIKDTEGKRLSDSMIAVSIHRAGIGLEKVVYDDVENKATMILSMDLASGVSEGDVVHFEIDAIFSNFQGELEYIDFDFENNDHAAWVMYFCGNRYEHTILGPWEMNFTVNAQIPPKTISVSPTDSPYLAKLDIECSPMATIVSVISHRSREVGGDLIDPKDVFLNAEDTEAIDAWNRYIEEIDAYMFSMVDYIKSFGEPYLTLNDGSIISLALVGNSYGAGGGQATYFGDYFDIEELYSITFCGEEYIFGR